MGKEKGRKLSMNELGRSSLPEFKQMEKMSVVIVLDDVRSLHNVGSVFRSADAFCVKKIFLCGITACPPHREIEKTALGATESVEWEYRKDILELLSELKSESHCIVGVEQVKGSTNLQNLNVSAQTDYAFVFGNEVKGVSQQALDQCDYFVEVPQGGTKHSLNISVSTGIVLWELYRQLMA